MEIVTTIKDFPSRIKKLGISPDTFIRVMIIPKNAESETGESHLPFLDSEVWDGEDTPKDLSTNVDHYLYDEENVHGQGPSAKAPKKSKWAEVAERISRENILDSESAELLRKISKEFREDFSFRSVSLKND